MTSTKMERLQLLFVLLIAAILRMAVPGISEFKADEARLYTVAYGLATGESLPLHGIGSSIGLPNFPLSVWLYAVPISLWRHPYSAILFTGLLSTVAVYASWWFTRRYWGARTGILCALFFSVSPWAVIFSRKIWAQNLLPLFVLGWAISAVMTFASGRRGAALVHGVLLGCVPQIHFSGLTLVLISAVTSVICRRRVPWRWLLSGITIAIILALPLVFHFTIHGIPYLPSITTINAQLQTDSLVYAWVLSTGSDINSLLGNSGHLDAVPITPYFTAASWLWTAFIALGCWRMLHAQQTRRGFPGPFIVAWLLTPIIILLWSPLPVYPHYFIVTFPAQYIAAAHGVTTILDRLRNPISKAAGWGLILTSGSLQIWALLSLFQTITGLATPGAYGTPLAMKIVAAETARATLASNNAAEILVVGNGNEPSIHEFPAVYHALLGATKHRFVDGSTSAIRTETPAIVILQTAAHPAEQHYLRWSTQSVTIPMRVGEAALKVLTIPGRNTEMRPEIAFSPPRTLANGVALLGFNLTAANATVNWELHWITGPTKNESYHFYNHLLDIEGNRIGQHDRPAFPAKQWRRGDRVISFFSTPITKLPAALRIGMYTYPNLENVPVANTAGNFVDKAVTTKFHVP